MIKRSYLIYSCAEPSANPCNVKNQFKNLSKTVMSLRALAFFAALICTNASAQDAIKVVRTAWAALSNSERSTIQQKHMVDVRDPAAYGFIIDNQGVNESSLGTNSGAALGAAIGNAAYIDRAFKPGNNYSAGAQLAVGLLGAVIGSATDRPALAQFHFRYALKYHNGEIGYHDSVQGDAFRHPLGICLEIARLTPAPQTMCSQTVDDLRRLYLAAAPPNAAKDGVATVPAAAMAPALSQPDPASRIECKLRNLAPFTTTIEKCESIGGTLL